MAYITECLGRTPTQLLGVAARNPEGKPAVITCHPLNRDGQKITPFPTMYWLIDPVQSQRISDLERHGKIGQFESLIANDQTLSDSLRADHEQYAETRWALLDPAQQQQAIDTGLASTLRDKGIGGIADFTKIKCLHLHLAHHLAALSAGQNGTTVGRLIESPTPPASSR